MGCKCENPSLENKNEIKSETGIKQTPLEPTTNRLSNNNENGEKNKKMKQYLIDEENNLQQYSDIHKNKNHDIAEPITFDDQKDNQNFKLLESNNAPEKYENENNENENNNNENNNNENNNNENNINENENNENNNNNNEIDKENGDELGNFVRGDEEEDNLSKNNSNQEIEKINIPKEPEDDFSKYIFQKINEVRKDPKSFIPIIEESKQNITTDKHGRLIYKSKVKVALSKGLPIFEEAISFLEQTEPMEELIYEPKITIPVPDNEEDIKNKNYLKEKVEEINQNYYIKTYWRDIIKHPETSFILMIVDDTGSKTGLKRKDILNPDLKYIGISSVMIEKSFVCYMTFSEKL